MGTGSFCWSFREVDFLWGEMDRSFSLEVVVLIGSSWLSFGALRVAADVIFGMDKSINRLSGR